MPLTGRWTLTRYLIEERRRYPQASGDLNALILDVALACKAIARIVANVHGLGEREITSRTIGEMVMAELYKLDKVAYIRFASVYKAFQDVEDFRSALHEVERPAASRGARKAPARKARDV